MATLPDVPQNTIVAIAVVAGAGLVAFVNHNKTKIESQIHDNYRHAKIVDANAHGGADIPTIHMEPSQHRSA
jgi:hypothetical protein